MLYYKQRQFPVSLSGTCFAMGPRYFFVYNPLDIINKMYDNTIMGHINNALSHKNSVATLARAERRATVAEMYLTQNMPQREIAKLLGVSVGTISQDIAAARIDYAERTRDTYEMNLTEQLAVIDELVDAARLELDTQPIPVYEDGEAVPGRWDLSPDQAAKIRDRAVNTISALYARKSKMTGLDITKIQVDKRIAVITLGAGMTMEDI